MTGPLVSIVTPMYNTEDYLHTCIQSVLRQSYQNFEYLIVNNCSTDRSREIAARYAKADRRVRLIDNTEFLSQVANYNCALRQISHNSMYCKIVQPDDWIFPDCIYEMIRVAMSNQNIALVSAYELAGSKVRCQGLTCNDPEALFTIMSGREVCRIYFLENKYLFGSPTSVMYRADLVRGKKQFYREDSFYEDAEVCFSILENNWFGFVHKVLTFSRMDNVSISTNIINYDPMYNINRYLIVRKYGHIYLSESEHIQCLERIEKDLYEGLGYQLFHRWDNGFWEFFEKGFQMADSKLSWSRLIFMQVPRILRWLGNPLLTLENLAATVKGRLARGKTR